MTGIDSGPVLRRVDKAGRVGSGPLTPQAVFETVAAYGLRIGLGKITPHDPRRTFAKLAHQGQLPFFLAQVWALVFSGFARAAMRSRRSLWGAFPPG